MTNGGVFDPNSFFKKTEVAPAPAPQQMVVPAPNPTLAIASAPTLSVVTAPIAAPAPVPAPTVTGIIQAPMVTAPVPMAAPIAVAAPAAPVAPVIEADDGGEMAIGVGQKLSRYPIKRFRGIKDFNRRVAILSVSKWYAVKTHYEAGIGSFYCFGSACCDFSDPQVRYLAPVLVYDVDRQANIISGNFTIEYLNLADAAYESLLLMHKNYPLDSVDVLVSCTDDHYQKLTFMAGGPATWKSNQQFAQAVFTKYHQVERHIIRAHARKLGQTPGEAEAAYARLRGDASNDAGAPVSNFNLDQFVNQQR